MDAGSNLNLSIPWRFLKSKRKVQCLLYATKRDHETVANRLYLSSAILCQEFTYLREMTASHHIHPLASDSILQSRGTDHVREDDGQHGARVTRPTEIGRAHV